MNEVASQLTYWHWLALCLVLLMAEMAGTGGYLLWAGFAAGMTAFALWAMPDFSWQWQLLFFSVSSVLSAVGWWQYQRMHPRKIDEPLLNNRSAQYVGRFFTLTEATANGRGRIRIDDSFWEVACLDDLPEGTPIRVVSIEHDQILRVEKK
jgi:membrane protein implicated in regulation of membrane protease activity